MDDIITLNDQLKPCPFCGRKAVLVSRAGGWTAECKFSNELCAFLENETYCAMLDLSTPLCSTPEEVIDLWNTRPIEKALREEHLSEMRWANQYFQETEALKVEIEKLKALVALSLMTFDLGEVLLSSQTLSPEEVEIAKATWDLSITAIQERYKKFLLPLDKKAEG